MFSFKDFLSSSLHLLQERERTNVFSRRYKILGFPNVLYLFQTTQYNFLIFLVNENILVIFYHSSHNYLGKINLYNLENFYLFT